jgi:precorrin-6A/cobalt-precorrin-6A reductase
MPRHAATAAERSGVRRLRLVRPPWTPQAGDAWIDADDLAGAARAVAHLGVERVLLTVGRLELAAFADVDVRFVVRTIEPPDPMPLAGAEVVRSRGPFSVREEIALLRDRRVGALVTKNAGGADAKLVAASQLGLPVVVVRRPPAVGGTHVATAPAARTWVVGGGR